MNNQTQSHYGSDNIFADIGLSNADELLVKAQLVNQISDLIEARQLTQVQAAEILGVDQPKVSALLRGKISGFSIDRLFRFLNALGSDVEIRVVAKLQTTTPAQTRVVAF
jgi:predicted XRE-type DNA-binding protein